MRVSNNHYCKGMVVFVDVDPNGELGFLNDRPLITISPPNPIHDTILICTAGTKDWPGIKCSLWNYNEHDYLGKCKESNIYPYTIYSVEISKIRDSMGFIDPYIMKTIDQCVLFHLGLSDTVPEYLVGLSKEVFDVQYNMGASKTITFNRDQYKSPCNKNVVFEDYGSRIKISQTNLKLWEGNKMPVKAKGSLDIKALQDIFDLDSLALILSRRVTLRQLSNKTGLTVKRCSLIRKELEINSLNMLRGVLEKTSRYKDIHLSNFDIVSIIYCFEKEATRNDICELEKIYSTKAVSDLRCACECGKARFNINFNDRVTWPR